MNGTDHVRAWTTHEARRRGLTVARSKGYIQTFRKELNAAGFEPVAREIKLDNQQTDDVPPALAYARVH